MGMYTALSLGVELNPKGTDLIDILRYMTGQSDTCPPVDRDAPIFSTPRWEFMLRCDSYYFDYQTHFEVVEDSIVRPRFFLSGVSNLKNYDDEINKFLMFLRPHIESYGFIGWTLYEEDEEPPILYGKRWDDESA